ncbi:glycosyltransferase involved in cell wall biosynthesis [Chryseobacterium bernardetii]|jgi:glycosyltransferase involved in cell wall biosynthesis|uniref:Glycosyltransferase involved in cell wall biosynthesis n=3 Tax=Chryseobacterium TaxID=59732 RepID=A0A543EFS2_9FLAO|nr:MULTISPECIES: glycosyltransferase family 4 protein [Chryseobacterium]MDR6370474.1 glycosyltransferase involved in cell wall biosynthesis [Chryseobacterium vietnamense]MDR6441480.1 glycosyltransferase involved in cell wall biosynthesis [Chryseobacterium bernardetii]MDR6456922.1 glycosyltransferase involved in cell wall biosynthesis [Chryseobacterium vietnamense]MDR6485586.1 glycosyltransferase involved in cell wall biosynthesis [Chryseobacterium vietnamense]TQM20434.1 glycosyltransferase inv
MNILYIHQYFVTPQEPGGTRSYWLAQELIKNGHKVTMLTSSSKFSEDIKVVQIDGIEVVYIKEDYDQNMSVSRRLKAFLKFMYKSSVLGLKQKDIDLVIATSTPLTIGIPALLLKWFKKKPFVFEVRDLWPEVPIQMGAIKNRWTIKTTRLLEKTIYKNASRVIALSPGMQDGVVKYIPKEKTSMIPNMAKMDEFWPRGKNDQLMEKLGLKKDSFKIVHFGSLGLANGAHSIVESAKLLKDREDIEFLFVGGGSTEKDLIDEVEKNNLKNVKFLGKFPMTDVSEIVNFSDVSMISFLDLPILYTNSPNKLFDSLSAGKPIIVNSAGWTKDIAEKYHCGYYVNPNRPEELVQKVLHLKDNPELVKKMGQNARKLAETVYDKSILCKKFVDVIEQTE